MAKRSATSDGSRKIRAAAYGVLQVTTFNPQRLRAQNALLLSHVVDAASTLGDERRRDS